MSGVVSSIEAKIAELISGMRVADGYNYDWSTSNQPDNNLRYDAENSAWVYVPHAVVYADEEECLDDENGVWAQEYSNALTVRIVVDAPLNEEVNLAEFAVNAKINDALDDLKRLFGVHYSLDGIGILPVMYRSSRREMYKTGDVFLPKRLETEWLVRYFQCRTAPSTY